MERTEIKIRYNLCAVHSCMIKLGDLLVGQAFHSGRYYIKTNRISNGGIVAVDLETGRQIRCEKSMLVEMKDFVIIRNESKLVPTVIPQGKLFTININDKTFLKTEGNDGVNVKTGIIEHIPKELSISYYPNAVIEII